MGQLLPLLYSTCPWRITFPADGSVPPLWLRTVYDPAYPSVPATGVVADRSCRVTAAVAGAGGRCCPAADMTAAENAPARHADTAPATTTTAMLRATRPRRRRRRPPRAPGGTPP